MEMGLRWAQVLMSMLALSRGESAGAASKELFVDLLSTLRATLYLAEPFDPQLSNVRASLLSSLMSCPCHVFLYVCVCALALSLSFSLVPMLVRRPYAVIHGRVCRRMLWPPCFWRGPTAQTWITHHCIQPTQSTNARDCAGCHSYLHRIETEASKADCVAWRAEQDDVEQRWQSYLQDEPIEKKYEPKEEMLQWVQDK